MNLHGFHSMVSLPLAQVDVPLPTDATPASWGQALLDRFLQVPPIVWIVAVGVGVLLIVLRGAWRSLRRQIRRARPANIHPSLQKYNIDRAEVQKRQREAAVRIVATSTGGRLAGYRLLRQVEAVFVEGYASPDEAMIALKATAVERGANAILNVKTDRTVTGRCSASGDAVVVSGILQPPTRPTKTEDKCKSD